jgi:hypothetical protein
VPLGLLLLTVSACSQPNASSALDGAPEVGAHTSPVRPGPDNNRCIGNQAYVYADADGDGVGTGEALKVACDGGPAPFWYSWINTDCDDTDPTKYRLFYRDADGDGVGIKAVTICAGKKTPPGYVAEFVGPGDCDDSNPLISFLYLVDADGDGVASPNAATVCGPKNHPPPNAIFGVCASAGPGVCDDCDDSDPNLRTLYYQDLDGDGYAASTQVSVCGNPALGPPPGFGIFSAELADCDDARADRSPGALDLWTDDVDSDCDGRLVPAPYGDTCTSVETCDPAWFGAAIDPACDAADLAIDVDVQTECERILWVVWIWNQGIAPVSEYTLTIESPDRTVVFGIRDPLFPGARYPYNLPKGLTLSGSVRFTVTMSLSDCNPSNNTVTKWTPIGACPV